MTTYPLTSRSLRHVDSHRQALDAFETHLPQLEAWGRQLAETLGRGGRLLATGNGGSAAQAQHLTAEIVGRYDTERRPLSAIALHTEAAALTAILNDYGPEQVFARQLAAHARPGDVCLLLSTSGRSPNMVELARCAHGLDVAAWALTGPAPNPLAHACDEVVAVEAVSTAVVQELHLLALHLVCEAMDAALAGTCA